MIDCNLLAEIPLVAFGPGICHIKRMKLEFIHGCKLVEISKNINDHWNLLFCLTVSSLQTNLETSVPSP